MTGYPSVSLLDGEGKLMTGVRAVQAPGSYLAQGRAPTPVEIRPQQAAWFDLAWTVIPHEDKGETTCPSAKTVRVTAPGAATAIALPLAFTPCGGQVEGFKPARIQRSGANMTQDTNLAFYDRVSAELADIHAQGLTKPERVIASRQGPVISVNGRDVLNFCANNYLGLAGDERVTQAGIKAQEKWGAGTAS
ncbi:hypothetical protein LTR94_030709, partial [Friedmanniomyces endolithicus]